MGRVVLLITSMCTTFGVGHFAIASIPLVLGMYPVVEVGSVLKSARTLSVDTRPVHVMVKAVSPALGMAVLPRGNVPEQTTSANAAEPTGVGVVRPFKLATVAAPVVLIPALLSPFAVVP